MENKKPCSKPPTKTGRFMTPLTHQREYGLSRAYLTSIGIQPAPKGDEGSPTLDGKYSYLKKHGVVAGRLLRKGYATVSPWYLHDS